MVNKNKKAQGLSTNAIILIVLGVIVLAVLVIGFTMGWDFIASRLSDEQHYKITKRECRNESEIIGKKLVSEQTIECEKIIFLYNTCSADSFKDCYNEQWNETYPCDAKECIYESYGEIPEFCESGAICCYTYKTEVREEKYSYLSKIYENIIKEEEICEQVEVEEIEIYDFKDVHNFTEDISDREHKCTFNEKTEYYVCESYFGLKRISKQELTTDWLDENCECAISKEDRLTGWGGAYCLNVQACDYDTNCSGCYGQSIDDCRCIYSKCENYKCGDYFVEVKYD